MKMKSCLLLFCLFLPVLAHAQYTFTRLQEFPGDLATQALIAGQDGILYVATTRLTPNFASGSIFRVRKDGTGFQSIFDFATLTNQNREWTPFNSLVEASDGKLYGVANGYAQDQVPDYQSMLYRINKDGDAFQILLDDIGDYSEFNIYDLSFETSDGWLYSYGGYRAGTTNIRGGIFRCRLDGSQLAVVHAFGTVPNDGTFPSRPILGSDGRIYGACSQGGSRGAWADAGVIYRMEHDGTGYQILHEFESPMNPSSSPYSPAGLLETAEGVLVGWSPAIYGTGDPGWLFKLNKDGSTYTNLLRFGSATLGAVNLDSSRVSAGSFAGFLYGNTTEGGRFGKGAVFRVRPSGGEFALIYHFGSNPHDANGQYSGTRSFIVSDDGSLYAESYDFTAGATPPMLYRLDPPRLQLSALHAGGLLQITATGATNTTWRIESRDALTGTSAWQSLTNLTLGPSPTVIQQPLEGTNRFYRAVWVP
jgi:hypothetical protein